MRILVLLAAFVLSGAAAAETHEHHHDAGAAALHYDAAGKPWPTDAALRRGMSALRAALAARLPAVEKGSLGREGYVALGQRIEAEVGRLVAQCKLAPEADEVLHVVVAELLQAADVMQGKAAGDAAEAAHRAVAALNGYGRYFRHPGWRPLE